MTACSYRVISMRINIANLDDHPSAAPRNDSSSSMVHSFSLLAICTRRWSAGGLAWLLAWGMWRMLWLEILAVVAARASLLLSKVRHMLRTATVLLALGTLVAVAHAGH